MSLHGDFRCSRKSCRETVLEVGYLGSKGTHLFTRSGINAVSIYTGVGNSQSLGLVDYKTSDANSTFHALQAFAAA